MKRKLFSILAGFAIVAITAIAQTGPPEPDPGPDKPPSRPTECYDYCTFSYYSDCHIVYASATIICNRMKAK